MSSVFWECIPYMVRLMERELCLQVPKSKSQVQTNGPQTPPPFFLLPNEMYCLTVLETTRPELRFLRQLAPPGGSEGKHFPCSSLSFCSLPVTLGVLRFISVSFFTLSRHLYLCVSTVTLFSSCWRSAVAHHRDRGASGSSP